MHILEYPDAALMKTCEFCQVFNPIDPYGLQILFMGMKAVCELHEGVGLAASQIGVLKRAIIYRDNSGQMQGLINPVITERSPVIQPGMEGCLSLPGLYIKVFRSVDIVVEGLSIVDGDFEDQLKPVTLVAEGTEARIIQHEVDHLSGVLITDHQGKLNRSMTLNRWMKKRKADLRRAA